MIRSNVGYDIDKFTWLAVVSSQEAEALLVRKQSPYRTVEDLQKAKRVTWGVEGIGIARWVHAFLAANELKIPFDVVAGYGGTGETLPGLLRGDFDVFTQPIDHPSTLPYIRSGEIVPIVNLGESRAKNAPDTPTAIELGYKNLIVKVFRAMVGPPGLLQGPPQEVGEPAVEDHGKQAVQGLGGFVRHPAGAGERRGGGRRHEGVRGPLQQVPPAHAGRAQEEVAARTRTAGAGRHRRAGRGEDSP